MAAEKLRSNFAGRVLGAGLAGLTALTPLSAGAQDAQPAAMTEEQELAAFGEAISAARDYARDNNSVAILFHIGEDIQAMPNRDEVIAKVEAHFEQQFASLGIEAESFSRINLNARATGLTYYYGDNVYGNADGVINLDLQEASDSIPSVTESLRLHLQTIQAQAEPDVVGSLSPNVGG